MFSSYNGVTMVVNFSNKNYYEILEVDSTVDLAEIKKAYKRQAKKYHPDLNKDKNSIDIFKLILNAYNVLSDPQSRKNYDYWLRNNSRQATENKVKYFSPDWIKSYMIGEKNVAGLQKELSIYQQVQLFNTIDYFWETLWGNSEISNKCFEMGLSTKIFTILYQNINFNPMQHFFMLNNSYDVLNNQYKNFVSTSINNIGHKISYNIPTFDYVLNLVKNANILRKQKIWYFGFENYKMTINFLKLIELSWLNRKYEQYFEPIKNNNDQSFNSNPNNPNFSTMNYYDYIKFKTANPNAQQNNFGNRQQPNYNNAYSNAGNKEKYNPYSTNQQNNTNREKYNPYSTNQQTNSTNRERYNPYSNNNNTRERYNPYSNNNNNFNQTNKQQEYQESNFNNDDQYYNINDYQFEAEYGYYKNDNNQQSYSQNENPAFFKREPRYVNLNNSRFSNNMSFHKNKRHTRPHVVIKKPSEIQREKDSKKTKLILYILGLLVNILLFGIILIFIV